MKSHSQKMSKSRGLSTRPPTKYASYQASKQISVKLSTAQITHSIVDAPFLAHQLSTGNAIFCCILSSRDVVYKKLFLSHKSLQEIRWDSNVVGQHLALHADIVATRDFFHEFSNADGVNDEWIGRRVHFLKGARLASDTAEMISSSSYSFLNTHLTSGFLKYRVDDNLHNGGFYVNVESRNVGMIQVYMAADLYKFMHNALSGDDLHRSLLVNVLTSSFWTLKECIYNDDGNDFVEKHYRVAESLRKLTGVSLIDRVEISEFQPDKAATRLVPLVFGSAGENRQDQFLEFEARKFDLLRSSLIEEKGSEAQVALLKACLSRESFFKWVDLNLNRGKVGQVVHEVFSRKLDEDEFKGMNELIENEANQLWSDVPLIVACRSSFWGMVTVNHIEKGIIEPGYLATNHKSISGVERIKRAIECKGNKAIDDVTRTILRKLSGLPEERGIPRSVSCDCPFGRAWWRQRILNETLLLTEGNRQAISDTLYASKTYWEKLLMLPQMEVSNSKPSRFGDSKVRTAFIWALSDYVGICGYEKLFDSNGLIDKCTRRFTRMSLKREFGVFEIDELKSIIKEEVIEPEHRANLKVGRS